MNKEDAIKVFENKEMPKNEESWRYTNVDSIVLEKGSVDTSFVSSSKDVVFCSLKNIIFEDRFLLNKYLDSPIIDLTDDKFTAMNTAFLSDVIFIHLKKNQQTILKNNHDFKKGNTNQKKIIILEEGSSLDYFEHNQSEESAFITNNVEVYCKENSRINFYSVQELDEHSTSIANWKANVAEDGCINWFVAQVGSKLSRTKIDTLLVGEGSQANTKGLIFGTKEQHLDLSSNVFHNTKNTQGNILVKGVLDNNATGVFRGLIKIPKEGQNTNSYLSDHTLVLDKNARSYSIPSLEIDANEVSASHGATMGKPDAEEVFYLRSRGLSEKEAERLIIQGYFSPVIDAIKIEEIKEIFEKAVKNKDV